MRTIDGSDIPAIGAFSFAEINKLDYINDSDSSHTLANLTTTITTTSIEPWCQDLQSNDLLHTATQHTTPLRQIVAVVFLILLVFTVVGNAFVIFVVIIDRRLRRITSGLIVSMAVADLLVALSIEMHGVIIVFEQSNDHLSSIVCELSIATDIYFGLCELLHLTCLAAERYLAICHPFLHQRCGKRFLMFIIILAWTVPIFFSFLPILTLWNQLKENAIYKCMDDLNIQRCGFFPNKIFSSVLFFVMFVLPTILLLFCYTKILQVALNHRRRIDTQTTLGSYINESQPETINLDKANGDGIPKSLSFNRKSSTDDGLNMINFDTKNHSPGHDQTVELNHQQREETPFIVNSVNVQSIDLEISQTNVANVSSVDRELNNIKNNNSKSNKARHSSSKDTAKRTQWSHLCRAIFGIDDFFRTSRSIVYVCISFLLTWTPYWTLVLISPFIGPQNIPTSAVLVALSLFSLGTAINPFVYYFCNTDVRKGIFRVVKGLCFKYARCHSQSEF